MGEWMAAPRVYGRQRPGQDWRALVLATNVATHAVMIGGSKAASRWRVTPSATSRQQRLRQTKTSNSPGKPPMGGRPLPNQPPRNRGGSARLALVVSGSLAACIEPQANDLGAAKQTFKSHSALTSARQPKNSFGAWMLALQGEVPAGAGAMNSRGSNLKGWRSMWRVTVAYAGCAGLSSRFRSPGSM